MSDAWQNLKSYYDRVAGRSLLSLFDTSGRFEAFSAEGAGLFLDYSKTNINAEGVDLLVALAEARDVAGRRDAMFAGEKINETEGRAVLHTALRADAGPIQVDGVDVLPEIQRTLKRMAAFAEGVRTGGIAAADGGRFADVVNIGIGGSDLGSAMATLALSPYCDGPRVHFVSNIDGAHIADTLSRLEPARTLVIVASKTFTTIETITNAETAVAWLRAGLGDADAVGGHLAALSTALDKTAAMGIAADRVFGFADWVGGRYSLWGPIGLSIMLAVGADEFASFLSGGRAMDDHFQTAPLHQNLPVLLGLIGVWHGNMCGYATRAILPYDQRLARLPAYLQQLDMESNGKRVALSGQDLPRSSGPVVWGEPGTNGQHAFYQLIHQGTAPVPCEFLIAAHGHEPDLAHQHELLKANCLAQSEALMRGRDLETARQLMAAKGHEGAELERQARHRVFPGNRPSTTLTYDQLTPRRLGAIIALYEHRVFVEGAIWGLNSFDQWGVELGKELATELLPMVQGDVPVPPDKDGSTAGLVARLSKMRTCP
jgi:glucose-6-phosphate isomerase